MNINEASQLNQKLIWPAVIWGFFGSTNDSTDINLQFRESQINLKKSINFFVNNNGNKVTFTSFAG
jgi:hypothetical protein